MNTNQTQTVKVSLQRVYLDAGGYTKGRFGKYFGVGAPLYQATSDDGQVNSYIRANSRDDAKAQVRNIGIGLNLNIVFLK